MDTALEYLAQRTRELYRKAIEQDHASLTGIQLLRQLERLRPEIFDVSRHLTDLFGEHTGALEQARADKAEKLILALHRRLLPIFTGIFATQGAILVKAGLELQGRGVGGVRLPLVPATVEQRAALATALDAAGLASAPAA